MIDGGICGGGDDDGEPGAGGLGWSFLFRSEMRNIRLSYHGV
jgi:hypothetical protein